MTWLLTCTGREHYLAGPSATHPDNVPSLREIAHSLAHINRFTGHANRAYSVAEHSLFCMAIARDVFGADSMGQLAALMHDAHECITGDMATPIKQVLGTAWAEFEAVHEQHLRQHYQLLGLYQLHGAMVKKCDLIALACEREQLTQFDHAQNQPWPSIDKPRFDVLPLFRLTQNLHKGDAPAHPAWSFAMRFELAAADLLDATQVQRSALDREFETA